MKIDIETKFSIGNKFWTISNDGDTVVHHFVHKVGYERKSEEDEIYYTDETGEVHEEEKMFATKELALKHFRAEIIDLMEYRNRLHKSSIEDYEKRIRLEEYYISENEKKLKELAKVEKV